MATANKILGQLAPANTSNTTLYTVPTNTQANVNIFIANRSATDTTIRVALMPSTGTPGNPDFIAYDMLCQKDFPISITGIALVAGDRIIISNAAATCTFVATGIEIT